MQEKLSDLLCDEVRDCVGRLYSEASVLSFVLTEPLQTLRQRLRPTNFHSLMQRAIGKIAEFLSNHALRQPAFSDDVPMEVFVANCRDDLGALLSQVAGLDALAMAPLDPLWDSCSLLALGSGEAAEAFEALRKIRKCAPASTLKQRPWTAGAKAAAEGPDPTAGGGEVVQRKLAEVLEPAGIKDLSVNEVMAVLGK